MLTVSLYNSTYHTILLHILFYNILFYCILKILNYLFSHINLRQLIEVTGEEYDKLVLAPKTTSATSLPESALLLIKKQIKKQVELKTRNVDIDTVSDIYWLPQVSL